MKNGRVCVALLQRSVISLIALDAGLAVSTRVGCRRLLRGSSVHVVIRLHPPLPLTKHENLHQLRPDYPISGNCDARWHGLQTAKLVVDIYDCYLWRDKPNAANPVNFGAAFVERGEDLDMALSEGGRTGQGCVRRDAPRTSIVTVRRLRVM